MIPKKIEAEQHYKVSLARAVEVSPGLWARPGDEVQISGARLAQIKDDVIDAVAIG